MLVTRFAPTPSGYLHEGNIVNLVLTSWLARAHDGKLLLRIDDFDVARVRGAYLDDVFRTIEWWGIPVDSGPSGAADFRESWSMAGRMDQFRRARDDLLRRRDGSVFVCRCSRRDLGDDGRCVAGCVDRGLHLVPGRTVLRLSIPHGPTPVSGSPPASTQLPPGEAVIWRRDDLPAYHLGSVVVDEDLGITALVRGIDLLPSSVLQAHLATLLPAPVVAAAGLRHHALLTGPTGQKLSKSAGAQARPLPHTRQLRAQVLTWARSLGAPIGITPP